jgi:hypothetical protein
VFGQGGAKAFEFYGKYIEVTPHSRLVWTNEEGDEGGAVTTATFEEKGGKTLLVLHDLYPSKEALDGAIASGATGGLPESARGAGRVHRRPARELRHRWQAISSTGSRFPWTATSPAARRRHRVAGAGGSAAPALQRDAKAHGAHLYGRNMYEVMKYWDAPPAESAAYEQEFARAWQATPKVVFSTTLESVGPNARLVKAKADVERTVRQLKAETNGEIDVNGARPRREPDSLRPGGRVSAVRDAGRARRR